MDFSAKKPVHIVALLLVIGSLFIAIIVPIFTYFEPFPSASSLGTNSFPESFRIVFDILVVLFSLLFVIFLFIVIPILWYVLVNRLHFPQIKERMNLRFEKMDRVILWGVLAVIIGLGLSFIADFILISLGVDVTKFSNIPLLEQMVSLPAMVILVTVQPIAEEIFFRGFLLDKINTYAGGTVAVVSTSIFFGIAHLSYGMLYPSFMAMLLGLVFGFVVLKTKNLYTSIVAHILLNATSVTLYILGKSLGF